MRPAPDKADSRFLLYYYLGPEFQDVIRERTIHGSTVDRLALIEFPKFPLRLPPLAEQKAIAAVLGALDDKIELNRRMNATLEAMARALFSNWIQSHDDEIGEHLVQDLVDERVLIIGDGYRAKNSEFADDGLPFIRAGNLRGDGLDLAGADVLSACSVKAAGHKVGMVGDVAFTSKGTVGRITRVSSKTGSFVYSPQVCFWRSTAPDKLHPNVLYRWMSTDDFTHQVATVSTQTDMAPYVSLQDQRKMVIQLPPPSAQREIATQLEAIDEKIAANAEQSRTLATLRDTLLPKLLSGELAVLPALGNVKS
jgi:type I restriction enzyme S subunit